MARPTPFAPGDAVQTAHGKGIVREVRNNGQVLVQIQQRTLVVAASSLSRLDARAQTRAPAPAYASAPSSAPPRHAAREVDLHGFTVDEALARIDAALDAALLAGLPELRFIHGRSGGKLRGALHQRLRAISAIRGLRLDPGNPGVTIVSL